MPLFILRHGEAERLAPSDPERPLTARGETETHAALKARAEELQRVRCVVASPYLRAQQTAAIVLAQHQCPLHTTPLVTPDGEVAAVCEYLDRLNHHGVLLVSHQPLVSQLLSWLTDQPAGAVPMGTSALARVDAEVLGRGTGTLRWLQQVPISA